MSATFSKSTLSLLAALALAALGTACSTKSQPQTGFAKISVTGSSAAVIADITRIDLSITGGTPGPIAPISATLTKAPNNIQWTGQISGIPASVGLTFTASAYNASNTLVYQGTTTATVNAGATAVVVIILQEQNVQPGPTNYAPVIDSITSSDSVVLPGTAVSVGFHSYDPDNNYPLAYAWSSTCTGGANGSFAVASGSLAASSTSTTVWTAPATNNVICTLGIKVTDAFAIKGVPSPSSVQTFFTIQVQNNNGTASVNAFPNSFPIITVLRGDIAYNYDSSASSTVGGVGQKGQLFATATDPDGDNLRFNWQVKCGATLPASIAVGSDLTGQLSASVLGSTPSPASFNPAWSLSDPAQSCIYALTVHDLCTNHNCGDNIAGAQGSLADGADRGGSTVGFLNFTAPAKPVKAPFVIRTVAPNASGPAGATVINPSTVYTFDVEASDPEGGTLSVQWDANVGATSTPVNSGNVKSVESYTSGATLLASMNLTARITSGKSGLTTTVTFPLVASDPCVGQADGATCSTGNLCVTGETCTAGHCGGGAAVVCAGANQCQSNTCNPNTGCGVQNLGAGTSCNNDSNGCTQNDSCNGTGVCVAGAAVTCNTPADVQCQAAVGACTSTGNNTFSCSYTPVANGTTCDADHNGCTTDSCQAGACTVGAAVTCSQSTNTCQSAAGTCVSTGNATHSCTFTNVTDGTACNTAGACTAGQSCTAGVCSGGTSACAPGQSCSVSGGAPVCSDSSVVPFVADEVQTSNFRGIAMDTAGNTFLGGLLIGTKPFGSFTLTSAGAGDVFVAKYDATGAVVKAVNYGDASDQEPTAIAVSSGAVAAIGQFNGALGTLNNTGAAAIDYLLLLDPNTLAITSAKSFNLGTGNLTAVGANPALGLVAICGKTTVAATDLVAGATYAGGTTDIVIGVYNSAGALQWSKEIGSANGEECDAITIDNVGNVVAAGKFDGTGTAVGFTGTALPTPGSSFRKHIWVATFNGTTGAAIAQTSFGSGAGSHQPNGIAVDASNRIVISGLISNTIPFGAFTAGTACAAGSVGCLVSAGASDAFVAQLNETTLAANWATRVSTVTRTTAATAASAALTTPSANGAGFVVKLPGTTGLFNTATAGVYGNTTNTVETDGVTINSQGTGTSKDLVSFGGLFQGVMNFGGTSAAINSTTGTGEAYLVVAKEQ
jgi:hypothetical protein